MTKKYFEILGISPTTDIQLIKKAYRKKAKIYHPDMNPSPEANQQFLLISEAYEHLLIAIEKSTSEKASSFQQEQQFKTSDEDQFKTKEELLKERMEYAKKRYAYQKMKEEQENEQYFMSISTGWNWYFFQAIVIGCTSLSILFFVDYYVLKSHWQSTYLTHGDKIQTYAGLNYSTIVPVAFENGEKLWVNGIILGIAKENPTIYIEKTHFLNETKQVIIWNYDHWVSSKSDFSVSGTFPLIPLVLLLPLVGLIVKGRNLSYSLLFIASTYLFAALLIVLLYSNDRWAHILTLGIL